ncbi:MAG: hypothetical protein JXA41_15060, partial [Deltaproteobacteria bacterium]|nr:hypothetical protein [Deltaproteobacteria bacterium]
MKVEMRTLIVFMMMLFILLTSTALAIQPLTLKKSIDLVPIPLIPACDSEGIRHGVPKDVTTLFRI